MTATGHKHLAVDDSWIAESCGIYRRVHPFRKHPANPVLRADQPWEQEVYTYGTMMHDRGRFRAWYQILNRDRRFESRLVTAVGYAESRDGIVWTKPLVGETVTPFGRTNIVMLASGRSDLCSPSVVRLPQPGGRARYGMLFFDAMKGEDIIAHGAPFPSPPDVEGWRSIGGEGLFYCTSRDGIAWRRPAKPVIGGPSDTACLALKPDGSLLAVFKTSRHPARHFRIIGAAESSDGETWSKPRIVLEPDWRDEPGTEFYGMSPILYDGTWLGLLWIYHNTPDDKRLDVQLAIPERADRPGGPWKRALERRTILETGERGDWDAGRVYPSSTILRGAPGQPPGEMWLYYAGATTRHDDRRYVRRHVGLATMRIDGFASLDTDHRGGWLETAPTMPLGHEIQVNLDAYNGALRILARPHRGPGDWVSFDPVTATNSVAAGVPVPPRLVGQRVRLRFELVNARLFAWTIVQGEAA